MTPLLVTTADRLYGLDLPEFTPARDAEVKAHRKGDREYAEAVRALRKPTTAAWVINLLVRREPGQVDQVLAVGAALREAQAALSGDDLRALTRQRRQLTAAVTQRARAIAAEHGQRITESVADQVETTLTAAMVDEGVAAAVRSGLLVSAIATTGIDALDLTEHVALPETVGFSPTPVEQPAPKRPELHVVPDPDAEAKKRAAALAVLRDAERAVEEATGDMAAAQDAVDDLEARSLQLQSEIEELRRQLTEHEDRQEQTDEELATATEELRAARTDLAAATSSRDRARQALDKLGP